MNIIDFIKGLFKSKTIDTYNIININDIVQIPKRDKLSKEQIILLDKYKQEYSEILSSKKVFCSKELSIGSFNEDIDMNINLLLNICINNKDNNNFGEKSKENNIDLMIKILKLRLCQNSLSNMETEIITRIIALKEIYKEKKYLFSPNKRNSIASEINNLTNTIVIYLNQKNAIQIEVDAYLDSIETLSRSNTISKCDEDKYLIDRKNELLEMISIVMNNIPSIIEGNIKLEIAQLERMLEIYVYNHKEDINKLDKELELLSKENKSVRNRDKLLEQITRLEFKYRIFDEFGRHIVTEDQINNLYRVKFDILTIDINNRRESPINKKTNSEELEVYKQIVMEKIEKIVTGNNSYVQSIFKKDASKAISKIVEVLKDGDRKFNYNEILSNKFFLTLLLSFDKEDGLDKFFEEQSVIKRACNICDFHENMCKWEEELPLITIYELISEVQNIPLLYQLYDMVAFKSQPYNMLECVGSLLTSDIPYMLPEGLSEINVSERLTEINVPDFVDDGKTDRLFLKKIREKALGKTVIFPASLKLVSGPLLSEVRIKGLELREGVSFVDENALEYTYPEIITIPSTLTKVPCINLKNTETIIFTNIENSEMINSFKDYLKFFNFYFKKTKKYYVSTNAEYEIIMQVPKIIFVGKNGYKELKRENFKITFSEEWDNTNKNYISFEECQIIHHELEKICNSKIKYSLGKVLYDF